MNKNPGRTVPSMAVIQAEAARVQAMIAAATQRLESSGSDLRAFTHLQLCRAELHAYLGGLLYALGQTEKNCIAQGIDFSDIQVDGLDGATASVREEDDIRFTQCFEC